ncbi:LruC domain-containing protein [Emticicia sp. BO119]|uniref:LruC domain-containing protein n=1 Tax=Emticicia sp. BO119 TaxID=2757768 RepID=UPI0015F0225D|nr:LruC domain-containing protein [Emticicia sp. BO119]MBA4849739.1 LruC domain-containing protein [Emticicia sp. BO119]
MKTRFYQLLTVTFAILLNACAPEIVDLVPTPGTNNSASKMDKLSIPANFNFNTSGEIKFDIGTFDNADKPIKGVVVSVYSYPEEQLLFKGITSSAGLLSISQKIPTYVKQVVIKPNYIGLPSQMIVTIANNKVQLTLGGKNPQISGYVVEPAIPTMIAGARTNAQDYPPISYMGSWDSNGVPKYLESTRDAVSSSFLEKINSSVPEGQPVPSAHPDFLNTANRNYLVIKELSDVWVTFVHEGAGWLNTLGYYTFDPAAPPTKPSDISKINIIFPNVSYKGDGGGLVTGDKVKLGRFNANTAIGFVLLANAYSSNTVGKGYYAHYSQDALNIETQANLRRHLIVLNDPETNRMVLAFEDVSRQNTPINCDNDFNDAIFFATSNPVKAIDTDNVPVVDSAKDTDGDGVGDSRDEYPNDPARAINNYTPSKNTYSTLAYEDLWPSQGDYDLNDLVVNYQFQEVLNASNQVVEMKVKAYVKAIGASFASGWGFQIPIDPSAVKSVTGASLTDGKIKTASNGLEADQKYAVVIAFDNAFKRMKSYDGFVNTAQGSSIVAPTDTLNLNIVFTSPVNKSTLGNAPFNPFSFRTNERGKEVHLPNMAPTSRADLSLFGTGNDQSQPTKGIYYKTATGLPWALDFTTEFRYPAETQAIIDSYLKFAEWAESGGTSYPDWYLQKTGYTDESKIFKSK